MKQWILVWACLIQALLVHGRQEFKMDFKLQNELWNAQWIQVPESSNNDYGVYHFRKTFDLLEVPKEFWVHISADNRYKLYVNGTLVSLGPARSDIYNWAYETVNIAPWLRQGGNTLASVVWNLGEYKPVAQISFQKTAFILQGNSPTEEIVNTNATWKGIKNTSYFPIKEDLKTYFVVGPGDGINSSEYPWGWETICYDDSSWHNVVPLMPGAGKGTMNYPGWQLVPRSIPQMELRSDRILSLRKAKGIADIKGFPKQKGNYVIPSGAKVSFLLDQNYLTTAYMNLLFSGGKDSRIVIRYAESLYEDSADNRKSPRYKGNRDEVDGKYFWGYSDCIIADGGMDRLFTSLWWRTYRYILLEIETSSDPLILHDIYSLFTAYPLKLSSSFMAPDMPELNRILDVGWRTARLCAHETYMDCPYYEQLQYFGDARIQGMVTLYNSKDDRLVRNAINNGRQSIVMDGITMSRYPTNLHQFIPSYSIWWIAMVYDFWMHRDDEDFVSQQLPYIRIILDFYERFLGKDNSLSTIPYWFFVDWADGFEYGEPSRLPNGHSSLQDLHYLIGLQLAAEMENAIGVKAMAQHYREIISRIENGFKLKYWDVERGLFADTSLRNKFSQHTNILSILSGIVKGDEAKQVMLTLLKDEAIVQVSIYFRYYLQMALAKVGLGNDYLDMLDIWQEQLKLGLTTWAEQPEPSRSDCHAWGCSPNIELYRIVLGIQSASPGFKDVLIAPHLGKLRSASGTIPHPNGYISVNYKVDEFGEIWAEVSLPQGVTGCFFWKGKVYKLKSGKQVIKSNL